MMSPDGRCKTFDAAADGYVRGEGCGLIVLKRLSDARRDGDPILALVRGTAVNQDGRSNGLTAPNPASQQAVIELALDDARMNSQDIDYVEAHGSGTSLGDPIEFESLAAVVGQGRPAERPCHIGSVKTNIGHLEAAAGIAGLIKVVLSMVRSEIPPHLHLKKLSPYIRLEGSGLDIPTDRRPWPPTERPRAAGVSSFGFGGTNAHVILEEAPAADVAEPQPQDDRRHVLCLSAKTDAALRELARAYEEMLTTRSGSLADVAYTANACRSHFRHRVALIAASCPDAAGLLGAFGRGESAAGLYTAGAGGDGAAGDLLAATAAGYLRGEDVDWTNLYRDRTYRRVSVPSYPFQRQRCWIDEPAHRPRSDSPAASPLDGAHPLAGTRIHSPALKDVVFQSVIGATTPDYLEQHRVYGKVVLPATALCEMVLAAARSFLPSPHVVEDVAILEPLVFDAAGTLQTLQTIFTTAESGVSSFQIVSLTPETSGTPSWKVLARGRVRSGPAIVAEEQAVPNRLDLKSLREHYRETLDAGQLYATLRLYGLDYGADFSRLQEVRYRGREALGTVAAPDSLLAPLYVLHPIILDSCLHLLGAAMPYDGAEEAYIPVTIRSLRVLARPSARMFARTAIQAGSKEGAGSVTADFDLVDDAGDPIAEIRGAGFRRVPRRLLLGTEAADFRSWLYRVDWRTKENEYFEAQVDPGAWLILSDRSGTGDSAGQLLDSAEQRSYAAVPGEEYLFDGRTFTINVRRPADFDRMFADLARAEPLPLRGVVQLWALDAEADRSVVCAATLYVTQAMARAVLPQAPRLCIVTRRSQEVTPGSVDDPRAAVLWGMTNVLHAEHPEWRTAFVDLEQAGNAQQDARFVIEEMLGPHDEPRVALRGKLRYVPRLVRLRATGSPADRTAFSARATYVVTGGMGAIGLNVAQWLARRGARQLVLFGRHGPSAAARARIEELERRGVQVRVEAVDVADLDGVRRAMARIQRELPPVRGVFHAAGVVDDALVEQQTWERFASVMSAKVDGTWNLHEVTKDMPLDHFVLFSSMSSLLPNPGQSNYAAANAFLDAFASYRQGLGLPALAVQWSVWDVPGLNVSLKDHERARFAQMGLSPIDPASGFEALESLMQNGAAGAAVFPVDWAAYLDRFIPGTEPPLTAVLAEESRSRGKDDELTSARQQLRDKLDAAAPAERTEILEDLLKQQVADVLGFASAQTLDPSVGFSEIGMDSVMAVELQHRIQRILGVSLPATALFDKPNIQALARHLAEHVLKFEAVPQPAVPKASVEAKTAEASHELDSISEDELVALLSKELDR